VIVNVISESALAKGQGVQTAFTTHVDGLRAADIVVRVNSPRPADIHHAHSLGPLFWLLTLGRRRVVISGHVTLESLDGSFAGYELWKGIAAWYLRLVYDRADRVVAVSPYVKRMLAGMGVTTAVVVVPNPVDRTRFRPSPELRSTYRARLGVAEGEIVVVACGQVQSRKGVATFLRLARERPGYRFLWVGGRPFGRLTAGHAELDRLFAAAGPNVTITGTVPFDDMPGYYNAADVFCLPSLQETFGFAIVEAAACGLPLVLRDLDVYPELFGSRYVRCAEGSFATAVDKLAAESGYRADFGAEAMALADAYSLTSVSAALIRLYQDLLT